MFSLDTELAWGSVHRGGYAGRERDFERTRPVIGQLLGLFERYRIRATWAVVGHLFLERCSPVDGVKHPEVVRPDHARGADDWFGRDPCTCLAGDPFWYGPDIVEMIRSCSVPQEIGCHNFSHMIVGDPGCSREAFSSELAASRDAASAHGVGMRSFVYPRNSIGHVDVLAEHGYTSYRGLAPGWRWRSRGAAARLARLADNFLPSAAPAVRPVRGEGGVVNVPASYNYIHRSGWGRYVPVGVRVRKAAGGLRRAAREGGVFHMWTHPFNIASDPRGLLGGLERIFQEYKSLADSGLIASRSMCDIAEAAAGTAGATDALRGEGN